MLKALFPRRSTRYLTLPLLGPVADEFDAWLSAQGYGRSTRRQQARALIRIDRDLRRHGLRPGGTWRQADFEACWQRYHQRDSKPGGTVRALLRFLQVRSLVAVPPPVVTRVGMLATIYGATLQDLRGLAPVTIRQHITTAAQFLTHLGYRLRPERLAALTASDVEAFVRGAGKRQSRATLQHTTPLPGVQRPDPPGPRSPDRHPARLSPGAPATQSALADRPAPASGD